ncbi:MAG: alanine racemase [Chitinivibrionales bacterium]|nr:alanine racemase [Chitinivibrionales bacterium]
MSIMNNRMPFAASFTTPCIELSLDNLLHNLEQIRSRLPSTVQCMPVIKDSAYGCGSAPIAAFLEQNGIKHFAVARCTEARFLRDKGILSPILVLGECTLDEIVWGIKNDIRFSLNDIGSLPKFIDAQSPVYLHCNIDTGMGRLGVLPSEINEVIRIVQSHPSLIIEGLYTHFASADVPHTDTVAFQRRLFENACTLFEQAGIRPEYIHTANSAGILRFPEKRSTLVRPGIILYGCNPDPTQKFDISLKPVVTLKGHVVKLKKVPAGIAISYGGNYVTGQETTIATISVGYAHGVPRLLSNRGEILLQGKRYTIAGNVTMDYCMVDCGSTTSIREGDEAVVMGSQGKEFISPDEIAAQCGTIGYEILCGLSTSVDRYVIGNNKVIHHIKPYVI